MSEEDREAQDKPLWEQHGFDSVEDMYASITSDTKGEKIRADALEAQLGAPNVPTFPEFNQKAYEADPTTYLASHQKELDKYREAVKEGTGKVSKPVLEATLKSVLAVAVEKGYDEDVVQGTIRSMVRRDEKLAALLDTPDGLRELGKLAMEKLKAQTSTLPDDDGEGDDDGQEDNEMANVPPEHRDAKGRSSAGQRQSTPKTSEVDRLTGEIATHVTEKKGVNADLVGLVIEQNLAHLGVEKPGKK